MGSPLVQKDGRVFDTEKVDRKWLLDHFYYRNGELIRYRTWGSSGRNRRLNIAVGSSDHNGYLVTTIYGRAYKVHRLIWFYFYGAWPKILDHIDRNPRNNSIHNLRESDHVLNNWNSKDRTDRISKFKGVYPNKDSKANPWCTKITVRGKSFYLGRFPSEESANEARLEAEKTLR
jgi:hypothetical protein